MLPFNEDTRVKIPATIQFLKIGYEYQSLRDENVDIDFNTKIFINRFKPAIEKINGRDFSYDEIREVISKISRMIRNNDLGKEFYYWLIDPKEEVKLIDFENVENNDFAIVDELPFCVVEGTEEGSFRPDINILINGMPLGFLEVKKPNNEGGIQREFDRMIKDRLKNDDYKKFFNLIQIVSFSNNMEYEEGDDVEDVRAGSFYTTPNGQKTSFSFFREDDERYLTNYNYKQISSDEMKYVLKDCNYSPEVFDTEEFKENLDVYKPCNSFITSVFDKERIMYFLHYGIMYVDDTIPEKHIMRYPQFFATRKIIERLKSGGKNGIIWHTQGSGKTGLAAFSNRVVRDYYAKKNINARFFFIVDRIDLLKQASDEFQMRGLNVVNCKNKEEFSKELNKTLSTKTLSNSIGEICVVNIHKFEDKMPEAKNEYDTNIQRIFFIDEAHRSYSSKGEFFKNLMCCDGDAVYIALTGTPLLSKKERTSLKFGDYIHKYFYDKSIADGYTLRIKKENVDTVVKTEIKNNLEIEDNQLNEDNVILSQPYIDALCKFINRDFDNFRITNEDNTIGGMIVAKNNSQAKMIKKWFDDNSKLTAGLVISDTEDIKQDKINEENQKNFKHTNIPDILIVNFMLTTGYDAKRLKKMYLLRGPHAQSLLQTISRVNRPYKSPTGKVYKYGYITDFVDIEKEFDNTLAAYVKELEDDLNGDSDDDNTLNGLVIDKNDIKAKYDKYEVDLYNMIDTENVERFQYQLTNFSRESLHKVRRLLNGMKECYTEFLISRAIDYAQEIDYERIKKLLKACQDRINFVNLSTNTVTTLDILEKKEVVDIIYEFLKVKVEILDLGRLVGDVKGYDRFKKVVENIQGEIKKNKNKKDIKIVKLEELLEEIFGKLAISNLDNLDELSDELLEAYTELQKVNDENDRLANKYGNNFAFVKTCQDATTDYNINEEIIEKLLGIIYGKFNDKLDRENLIVQGRKNFVDGVKKEITKELLKEKIYVNVKDYYDHILSDLYTNLQLYK